MFQFQSFDPLTHIVMLLFYTFFHYYSIIDLTNKTIYLTKYSYSSLSLSLSLSFSFSFSFSSFQLFIYLYFILLCILYIPPIPHSSISPFRHFHLYHFPTFHPAFLSTYQFRLRRSSQLAHIHSHSSLLSILLPNSFYSDFVSTFYHISASKPVLVCSIPYSTPLLFTLPHDAITSVESPICGLHATSRTRSLCPLSFDSNSHPFSTDCPHLFLAPHQFSHSIMCTYPSPPPIATRRIFAFSDVPGRNGAQLMQLQPS